jgi:hypothetical protein
MLERSVSSSSVQYLHQIRSHGVLRVLVRQEACDVDDGRVDAAADVPPRGGLLGDEHLGAADVVDVDQRHAPAGPDLDALQREERCNVTCVVQCTSSSIDSLPTLPTDND